MSLRRITSATRSRLRWIAPLALSVAVLFGVGPLAHAAPIHEVPFESLMPANLVTVTDIQHATSGFPVVDASLPFGGSTPVSVIDSPLAFPGVSVAERFVGQTTGQIGEIDGISFNGPWDDVQGAPSGALQLAVGAPSQNLAALIQEVAPGEPAGSLAGVGPAGAAEFDGVGEGAIAFLFAQDQSEFGFRIPGGNLGQTTLSFFDRNGVLIDVLTPTVSGLTSFGFRRDGGLRDVAGVLIENTDLAGIGVYDVAFDVVPEPHTFALLGFGLLGLAVLGRPRPRTGPRRRSAAAARPRVCSSRQAVVLAGAVMMCLVSALQASGASFQAEWLPIPGRNADGDWSDGSRWSIPMAPAGTLPQNQGGDTYDVVHSTADNIRVDLPVVIQNLELAGRSGRGLLFQSSVDSVTVVDTLRWIQGGVRRDAAVVDGGELIVEGTLDLTAGTGSRTLHPNAVLRNRGTAIWDGSGQLFLNSSGSGGTSRLINEGTFLATGEGIVNRLGRGVFDNRGTFLKDGAVGNEIVELRPTFTNSGLVELRDGEFQPTGGFQQHAGGVLRLAGGDISGATVSGLPLSVPALDLQGGLLEGHGRITARAFQHVLRLDATLAPGLRAGDPTGRIELTGRVSFAENAVLDIDLGGREQGISFDFVSVLDGSVDLGGFLEVGLVDGFAPSPSDEFTVLELMDVADVLGGMFANVASGDRLALADGAGSFLVFYGTPGFEHRVVLTNFVPEPASGLLVGLGLLALGVGRRRSRQLAVRDERDPGPATRRAWGRQGRTVRWRPNR